MRDLIQVEVLKLIAGPSEEPTVNQALIDSAFPLICPVWDYNMTEVGESSWSITRLYWQVPMHLQDSLQI